MKVCPASVASRRLLFVESAKRWDGVVCYPFAVRSNLDPHLERSLFVYSKFSQQLQLFVLPNQFPEYLSQCLVPQLSSFVTFPNPSKFDDSLEASEVLQVRRKNAFSVCLCCF